MPQVLAVAAPAILRAVGTRMVAGAAGRAAGAAGRAAAGAAAGEAGAAAGGGGAAAGRALQFGGRALQMQQARRIVHSDPAPRQPQGHLARTADWARNNPIEAGIAAKTLFSGSTLADNANADFQQVTQPRQFSG